MQKLLDANKEEGKQKHLKLTEIRELKTMKFCFLSPPTLLSEIFIEIFIKLNDDDKFVNCC